MAEEKDFIEPNSGRFSQPGGAATYAYELPPTEQKDLSEDVKTQIQDDPEGLAAINPDEQTTVPEPLLKQLEEQKKSVEENTTARTGETVTGSGDTVVSKEQAEQSGVAPDPVTGGGNPEETVEPEDASEGGIQSPADAPEPRPVPVPQGEEGAFAAGSGASGLSGTTGSVQPEGGSQPDATSPAASSGEVDPSDPGRSPVSKVLQYIEENPDKKQQIIDAEKAGKGRKGILDA